jgi:CDP-diglyceride synthetase
VSDSPANDATRRSDERTASKFTNRLAAALSIGIVFVALSAADAYGFAGMQAGWWLLPVAIGLAVAATDELIRLYTKRGLLLPGRLLRPGVALVVLSGILRPQQADAWAALAAPAIVHVAFLLLIMAVAVIDYRPERLALERLAGAFFVATYIGMLITFLVALRFVVQPDGGRPDMLPLVSLVAVVKIKNGAGALAWKNLGGHDCFARWGHCHLLAAPRAVLNGKRRHPSWKLAGVRASGGACRNRW